MKGMITTYLEMQSPKDLRPKALADSRFTVLQATVPQWQFNRFLYQTVGEPWGWRDKLPWTEQEWRAYVEDPALRTFGAFYDGSPAGYFELKQHDDRSVEIAYFGLMPAFIGKGLGGHLLTRAIEEGWALMPARLWVHTCTLDHQGALPNYLARGFKIYKTETAP